MTRGEGDKLDRDKIVQGALQVLDEVGLDGLSTRLLADWLGVRSPALYWHFKSKGELVDAMAEAMLKQTRWPDPPHPEDEIAVWLTDRSRAFRRALLSHRDGARVHAGTRPSPSQLPALDAQVTALTNAGLTPTDASRAALAVSRYTVGWVLEEQADSSRSTSHREEVDLSSYPQLEAARNVLEQRDPDSDFDFGLTALVAGLIQLTRATAG